LLNALRGGGIKSIPIIAVTGGIMLMLSENLSQYTHFILSISVACRYHRNMRKEYIEDLYDKNNKPQEEDIHLETEKMMAKDHRYFSVNLKQHSVS